jgi:hypothetical protein
MQWACQPFTVCNRYIAGSTLALLATRGVQYIYSALLCDAAALTPATSSSSSSGNYSGFGLTASAGCPAADPAFVGPAIYAMDMRGKAFALGHVPLVVMKRKIMQLCINPDS